MFQHMEKHHPNEYKVIRPTPVVCKKKQPSNQLSLKQIIERKQKYPKSSPKHKALTRLVTRFVCSAMLPIHIVDNKDFRQLIENLDCKYDMPGRNHFRYDAIPALYNEVRSEIEKELSEASSFSLTMDAWSAITTDPFLCVTCHFVGSDFVLKSRCLTCVYVPEDHTGINIASRVEEVLEEFQLKKEELLSVTTDAGSNMVVALKELKVLRLTCFGHVLHNAITNALKDQRVSRAMGMCRRIVSAFSFSFKKAREFRKIQEELQIEKKTLKSDVSTRWGSVYRMLRSIKANHLAIQQLFSKGNFFFQKPINFGESKV